MRQIVLFTLFLLACTHAVADEAEQIEKLQEAVNKQNAAQAKKVNKDFANLQKDLESNDPQVRARAVATICASQDARLIPVIRALLRSTDSATKTNAILALHRLQAKGAGAEVGKLISDNDPNVRHAAAEYGSQLGYKSTQKEVQAFLKDNTPNSQSIAMHLAQTLPAEQAAAVLAPFLHHTSPDLRKRAVSALTKYEDKLIQPHAVEILTLSGDTDIWVQGAVREKEEKLQSLLTQEELRGLSRHKSPAVRAVALRMLGKKGDDVAPQMTANLRAADPVLREAALKSFMDKGSGPEKEIVALLDDPNRRVKAFALHAIQKLQFKSAVPKLQIIFAKGDESDRKNAAEALLKMDESLWAPQKPPQVAGALFGAAAKLAGDDKESWAKVLSETKKLTDNISKLKNFPCDRTTWIISKEIKDGAITTRGPDDDHTGGKLGGHTVSHALNAVIVTHGNLAINGYVKGSMVIVTGDLYVHDGYIYDSIVLVQGKIICGGYIRNSIAIAGSKETLTLDQGYIWGSVAVAGGIDCDSYYKDSLLGGNLKADSSGRIDIRESARIDPKPIYGALRGAVVTRKK